jgi:hypothetical protein
MVQSGTQPLVIPPDVAKAAVAHNLGALVDQRQTRHRFKITLVLLTVSVVSFALLYAFIYLVPNPPDAMVDVAKKVFAVLCALTLACAGQAVRILFKPAKGHFIYERGFVYRSGSRIQAFGWQEVASLRPKRITRGMFKGKVGNVELVRAGGGKPISVPVNVLAESDRFAERLVTIVRGMNRPVD